MKNKLIFSLVSFLIFSKPLIGQEKEELISLFNGIDLTGWKIHGTEKWYVENGDLVCENGPDKEYGYLSTNEYYDNFILTLEFKQESNGNSGVFFRSTLDGIIINGWQVEVAPSGLHTGGIYESYGRGWLAKPDPKDENLKDGDWNTMKIMVDGSIRYQQSEGSIHKVAAKIIGAESCNGWTFWHYKSGNSLKPIDDLRQRLRPTN